MSENGSQNGSTQPSSAAVSDSELQAALYFAVGVSSEGSVNGRNVGYQLSFAGYIHNEGETARRSPNEAGTFHAGQMEPIYNSGYSIGTLQTDLGQQRLSATRNAGPLLEAYQQWAETQRTEHPQLPLTASEVEQTKTALHRQGNEIRGNAATTADNGYDVPAGIKNRLNQFLESDAGISYVHGQDVAQVNTLMRANGPIDQLKETTLYQQASGDDKLRMATVMGKLANQSGERHWQAVIDRIEGGQVRSLDALKAEVPAHLHGDRDNALRGAELAVALRNAGTDNPLRGAWQDVTANPLVNPTRLDQDAAHPDLKAEYSTVKSLFATPEQGQSLVRALDDEHGMAKDIKFRGAGADETAGLYASGHDFVHWNRDGKGFAHVGGQWQEADRNQVVKTTQQDGTVELTLQRNGAQVDLLHVASGHARPQAGQTAGRGQALHLNDRSEAVGQLQQDLAALGVTARDGSTLVPDNHFGAHTKEAVQTFQEAHGLHADGVAGSATLAAVAEAKLAAQQPAPTMLDPSHPAHGMYNQAYGCVARLDQERGTPSGPHSQSFAGSLTSAALAAGFNRIDHVVLSDDACRGYAVQGDLNSPFKQYTDVNVMTAIQTPLAQSSQEAAVHVQAASERAAQANLLQATQEQASQSQAAQGPAMSR